SGRGGRGGGAGRGARGARGAVLRAVAGRARVGRAGVALAVVALGRNPATTGAAVGAVEAAALEHDPDRGEDLAQVAGASRALGQGGVGEGLHGLEAVVAGGAGVLVGRHVSLRRHTRSSFGTRTL